ncbi:sugar ABC transporter ATP-binding protein [Mycolicibacterium sp.]|uniref:sugar ABC transporter ATP-binding protein n=1 Tax=Mycolicibacterium sp. TaxID=2320850 RepID=UPI0037C83C97
METRLRLQMRAVSKRYGSVQALNDVDFELRPGEVMALLGENGAGKSTLVKTLAGLVRPDEGEILIDGSPVDLSSSRRSREAGVAVIQQEFSSVATLSVVENLFLGQQLAPFWWTRRSLRGLAGNRLEAVGLGHLDPDATVDTLTVAEAQLLEIARVLGTSANVVVFDEPTAALSDAEIVTVKAVVRSLAGEGKSIVYVTHRLNEVFEIADRVTIMRNGTNLPPEETSSLDVSGIVTRMLGRRLEMMYPERSDQTELGPTCLELEGAVIPGLKAQVSLTAAKGEIIGFTGQVGSGADRLVQAMAGEIPLSAGSIKLNGVAIGASRAAGIQRGVAYCSSDRKRDGIFYELSIQTNLSSAWLDRVSSWSVIKAGKERDLAADVAAKVAITSPATTAVGHLSGGNQQKVALGKWIGRTPEVLLIEEPTRGVDVGARAEIYSQLRRLADSGMLIVICSSDTGEVYGVADRIATFYRGEMRPMRHRTEITESALATEVMHHSVSEEK